jgi:hypothetical protein
MIKQRHHIGAVDYLVMQNYSDSNQASQDSGDRPYVDVEVNNKYTIREFGENIDPIELMWHRDDEDRVVQIIEVGDEWKFQYDNELPWKLEPNMTIVIPRHEWHRVHKGEGKLLLKIWKE